MDPTVASKESFDTPVSDAEHSQRGKRSPSPKVSEDPSVTERSHHGKRSVASSLEESLRAKRTVSSSNESLPDNKEKSQQSKRTAASEGDSPLEQNTEETQRVDKGTETPLEASSENPVLKDTERSQRGRRSATPSRRRRCSIERSVKKKEIPKPSPSVDIASSENAPRPASQSAASAHKPNMISSVVLDILASNGETAATGDEDCANAVEAISQGTLIERAKQEARKQILDQSRKGPLRVRVTIRKKNKDGSARSSSLSRRLTRSSIKGPLSPTELEGFVGHDSFSPINSDNDNSSSSKLERGLLRKPSMDEPSLETPVRRGRRACVASSGGFNPNNVDLSILMSPKLLEEKSSRGRDVLHREDRLRSENEISGVVEKVIRNRREQSVDARSPKEEEHSSKSTASQKAPVRNKAYSNLPNADASTKRSKSGTRVLAPALTEHEAEEGGHGNRGRRKLLGKLLLGGSSSGSKKENSNDSDSKSPRRKKSSGFRQLG